MADLGAYQAKLLPPLIENWGRMGYRFEWITENAIFTWNAFERYLEGESDMIEVKTTSWRDGTVDMDMARRVIAHMNEMTGFVPDPTATPRKAQEIMRVLGIRAEDNIFSCGIMAARDKE